jgi:hypothetical protein
MLPGCCPVGGDMFDYACYRRASHVVRDASVAGVLSVPAKQRKPIAIERGEGNEQDS